MEKVLISACLIGDNTKYDGKNNYVKDVEKLFPLCDLIIVCPEVMGGLKTPRAPNEIKDNKVINIKGTDVSKFFHNGASLVSYIAKENKVKYAVLKENSPSCGVNKVYDGTFQNNLKKGQGVTTQILLKQGIKVFNEKEIDKLVEILSNH